MNGTRANRSDVTIDGLPSTRHGRTPARSPRRSCRRRASSRNSRSQTATFDASLRQHRRGRHESRAQVGHQSVPRRGLLREDAAVDVRQRLLREREQHSARPTSATRAGPATRASARSCGNRDVLHLRLRNDSRGAAAQQRHAQRADARRCATAISPSCSRSDRSISSTTRSPPRLNAGRPRPAGSLPRQHHSAGADEPGRAERARLHRAAEDAGQRRRQRQLPAAGNEGRDGVRLPHHAHRPRADAESADVRPRELVRSEQQLQQLLRQPLDRSVVPVRLAPGRRSTTSGR